MTNGWSSQAYVQRFDLKAVTFKQAINMFGHMEIADNIHEGIVDPYYNKSTGKKPPMLVEEGKLGAQPPNK